MRTKSALITGGAGNLAVEYAMALQSEGYHVIMADLQLAPLRKRVAGFEGLNPDFLTLESFDVSDEASVKKAAARIHKTYDQLNVLINNAQYTHPKDSVPFEDLDVKLWNQILKVNLTGTFLCCKYFGSQMAKGSGGSIINIASIYASLAPDFSIYNDITRLSSSVYSASKSGIIGLTKYLSSYWADQNIRINCISPGGMDTGLDETFKEAYSRRVPMKRMGRPSELQGIISWLAGEKSSYVTGQNFYIDGGLSVW